MGSLNPHPLPHLSPKPIPLISMVIMAILTTEVTTDTPIGTLARGVLMPNPWPDPNPKPKERLIPNPFTMVITVILTVTTRLLRIPLWLSLWLRLRQIRRILTGRQMNTMTEDEHLLKFKIFSFF